MNMSPRSDKLNSSRLIYYASLSLLTMARPSCEALTGAERALPSPQFQSHHFPHTFIRILILACRMRVVRAIGARDKPDSVTVTLDYMTFSLVRLRFTRPEAWN